MKTARFTRPLSLASFLALLLLTSACTTPVEPTVTMMPYEPLTPNAKFFVVSSAQRNRVVESLQKAGLRVASNWSDADYALNVKVGDSRSTRECGTVNNIAYVLNQKHARILVIKGRGWTGQCEPNIFDEMSQKLATY